jgi:predicted esterase
MCARMPGMLISCLCAHLPALEIALGQDRIHIPDLPADVRLAGVFCHHLQDNEIGRNLYDGTVPADPRAGRPAQSWRAFATERRFAQMTWRATGKTMADGLRYAEQVRAALNQAAVEAGRPELATAPLLFTGLSQGGTAALVTGLRMTDRTIAVVATHGISVRQISADDAAGAAGLPVLFTLGGLDHERNQVIVDHIATHIRSRHCLWTQVLQLDTNHPDMGDQSFVLRWVDAVLRLRLDPTGGLRPLEERTGWIGTRQLAKDGHGPGRDPGGYYFKSPEIMPAAAYAGAPGDAVWLPDADTAQAWKSYHLGKP